MRRKWGGLTIRSRIPNNTTQRYFDYCKYAQKSTDNNNDRPKKVQFIKRTVREGGLSFIVLEDCISVHCEKLQEVINK